MIGSIELIIYELGILTLLHYKRENLLRIEMHITYVVLYVLEIRESFISIIDRTLIVFVNEIYLVCSLIPQALGELQE